MSLQVRLGLGRTNSHQSTEDTGRPIKEGSSDERETINQKKLEIVGRVAGNN